VVITLTVNKTEGDDCLEVYLGASPLGDSQSLADSCNYGKTRLGS